MKITELVIGCFNMDAMLAFYENVFDINFKNIEIKQMKIHESYIDAIKITLCPASMAGITARDNRHQLTFAVDDIRSCIKKVEAFGGIFMNLTEETNKSIEIAIRDVDGNSIVLKQTV
ncbi:hypothetical protein N7U66_03535 [Lacinutrix neustonica]|uniref:VOC domain-containing protein n=1 Tax=Lacinutrix neustonica TaxID=2980107 RepID=A0A9E8MWR4_9FLAO|nr:VOC family protein [Lacinutrix neustonica]WAC02756.1 hypothetical protein N7U66_03535 [Lacinutrix neustonica]